MEKIRNEGNALKYVTILPEAYSASKSYPLIILLHGYGSTMHDLASLAPEIDPHNFVYVCPNAPHPISLGPGLTGFAWARLERNYIEQDKNLTAKLFNVFLEEILAKYQPSSGQILIGGFSQGAMVSYRIGLPKPNLFAGIIALSGRIDDQAAINNHLPPQQRTQKVFIAHGTNDPLISIDQAKQSLHFLEAHGYNPNYFEYDMAHEITSQVLTDLTAWIKQILIEE